MRTIFDEGTWNLQEEGGVVFIALRGMGIDEGSEMTAIAEVFRENLPPATVRPRLLQGRGGLAIEFAHPEQLVVDPVTLVNTIASSPAINDAIATKLGKVLDQTKTYA